MTIHTDPAKRRKTRRIYYGPSGDPNFFWTVKVKPAATSVKINGTLEHALEGVKGSTVRCHLSNCATANKRAFPHPNLMAVFTKTTALIVTKVKNGEPSEAIEYKHAYGELVELNDKDAFKSYIKAHPEMAERDFILNPPDRYGRTHGTNGGTHKVKHGKHRAYAPRGALKRAVDAGILSEAVGKAINKMHEDERYQSSPKMTLAKNFVTDLKLGAK